MVSVKAEQAQLTCWQIAAEFATALSHIRWDSASAGQGVPMLWRAAAEGPVRAVTASSSWECPVCGRRQGALSQHYRRCAVGPGDVLPRRTARLVGRHHPTGCPSPRPMGSAPPCSHPEKSSRPVKGSIGLSMAGTSESGRVNRPRAVDDGPRRLRTASTIDRIG